MKSKNIYYLPLKIGTFEKIDTTSSPAHIGKLKNAIDFPCKIGTPVYASLSGIVVWVKDDSNKGGKNKKYWMDGNRIVIKHKNKEYSAYEHLKYKGVVIKVGDKVKKGQLIGFSGNTGYTFGPHLHFEVFKFTGPDKINDFETLEVKFKMKICAIGDPHGSLEKIKKIPLEGLDLVILTGDLGSANLMREMAFENIERKKQGLPEIKHNPREEKKAFMEAYTSSMQIVRYLSKHLPVYIIYGNVESSNAETKKKIKKIKLPLPFLTDDLNELNNVRVINNKLVNFNGVSIGGLEYFIDTCWVREFKPTDYEKSLKKAKKKTNKAKNVLRRFKEVDILVCHQPPYGVLDKVTNPHAPKHWIGNNAGSKVVLDYIKRFQPKYVFCGHIHEGEGHKKIGKSEVYNLGIAGHKIVELEI